MMLIRADFSERDTQAIYNSDSRTTIFEAIEDAADNALCPLGLDIEWIDHNTEHLTWSVSGHVLIDGEPHDVDAIYSVSVSGNVIASRVEISPADLED